MIVGTTVFKLDGNTYYSPEFPRGGLAATFSVDLTHLLSIGFLIGIETRNTEDTAWTPLGSFPTLSSVKAESVDLTGLKEMVRFAYTFDAGDPPTAAVHFLMQAPSWRPY